MKHEIQLTAPDSGTVHVDSVKVEDGVYAKTLNYIAYWIDHEMCFIRTDDPRKNDTHYETFEYAVKCWSACWDIFTLSGLRIVTEKVLTLGDLKNGDAVGFVGKSGVKYQVINFRGVINAISAKTGELLHDNTDIQSFLNMCNMSTLYRFDTPQELHAWLAE